MTEEHEPYLDWVPGDDMATKMLELTTRITQLERGYRALSERCRLQAERLAQLEQAARERQGHGLTAPGKNASGKLPEALGAGDTRDKVAAAYRTPSR